MEVTIGFETNFIVHSTVLTLIGMSSENKKCLSLAPSRSKFYKTQWVWQGQFSPQISLEIFDINQADKIPRLQGG